MAHDVCPRWLGFFLASPLRKLRHDPTAILSPHVRERMTVLEPGPGMGFFTLELARLVGPSGRVIALDVQAQMLIRLAKRGGRVLLSEPAHHVTGDAFEASVAVALRAGFARIGDPAIRSMHSVILQKP
jgi:predicted methyltransferase